MRSVHPMRVEFCSVHLTASVVLYDVLLTCSSTVPFGSSSGPAMAAYVGAGVIIILVMLGVSLIACLVKSCDAVVARTGPVFVPNVCQVRTFYTR